MLTDVTSRSHTLEVGAGSGVLGRGAFVRVGRARVLDGRGGTPVGLALGVGGTRTSVGLPLSVGVPGTPVGIALGVGLGVRSVGLAVGDDLSGVRVGDTLSEVAV